MKTPKLKRGKVSCLKNSIAAIAIFTAGALNSQNVNVSGALGGNGTYATLSDAFTAINGAAQTAASITVDIVANTTETASAILNAGAWTNMVIQPSGGAARTVSGAISGHLIDLNGAGNVRIDGLNSGGNALVIANSATGSSSTIRFIAAASNNTIINCEIQGSSTNVSFGTIFFSTATAGGNSNNLISACSVGPVGSSGPANAVLSIGTAGNENSGNVIQSCNIFDYFNAGIVTNGILISTNNSAWTISGNRLYQTGVKAYTTTNTHNGIRIASGGNHQVTNNIVGYASSAATGAYLLGGTVGTRFIGIDLAVATTSASAVQGNTISAISLTTSGTAATANGVIAGINITSGNAIISNNVIGGVAGVDLITSNQTSTGGMVVGINSSSTGTMTIQSNTVGGLTSAGLTAALSGHVVGINLSGISTAMTITGNVIGNSTPGNMRSGVSGLTTATGNGAGIAIVSTYNVLLVITGNLVQNFAVYSSGTSSYLRGIWTNAVGSSGSYSITSNRIRDFVTNAGLTSTTDGKGVLAGIIVSSGTDNVVSTNTISNLALTSTNTSASYVQGISVANGPNFMIEKNLIYDLKNSGTSTSATGPSQVAGIFIRSSSSGSVTVRNNMISLGNGQSSNTAFIGIVGNYLGNPTITRIYFNTINIEGVVASGAQPSFGFCRTDFSTSAKLAPLDIRNNLITNTRSGGTGAHFAIGNNYGATPSATGWSSDYNILNADPSTVGWWGGNLNFSAWKTTSAGDANSNSGIPVTYVNSVNDLHLNMGLVPTPIESGGTTIASVSDDIDGQNRPGPGGSVNGGGLAPDIGADEIDGVVYTCTNAIGGTIPLASGDACAGQTLVATAQNMSSGTGIVYQWQVGTTPGGPYANVTGGSGATTPNYTSAPLPTGVYYVVLRTTCTSASISAYTNEATLTVHGVPSASASASAAGICEGGSIGLNGSGTNGTSFQWSGPFGFSATSANTTIANATPLSSGEYSLVVSNPGCSSTVSTIQIDVHSIPSTLTVTPPSSQICLADSAQLMTSGGQIHAIMDFTPQTNQNTATTYPAVYHLYYGGQRTQFLILASELQAAGLTAGALTGIQFPVVSLGANWGGTTTHLQDFQVSVGHTALSAMTSGFQTGLTVVAPQTNYTPKLGYNNLHTFSTPFIWDGTSNIIVETMFTNNILGTSADAVIQYNSPTTFQSMLVYRADNQNFTTMAASTTSNTATNFIRHDFRLHGSGTAPFVWSPSTGLASTANATVNASPPSNTVYTVTANNNGCTSTGNTSVSVVNPPVLTVTSNTSSVCEGGSFSLTASGATTFTWTNLSTGSMVVVTPPAGTHVYTVESEEAPCATVSETISVTVAPNPTVTISASSSTVCAGSSITLNASGAALYAWSTFTTGASLTVTPLSNTTYTVVGVDPSGCGNSAVTSIQVFQLPLVSASASQPIVCMGSSVVLTATGADSYEWQPGNQSASSITVTPVASGNYTVTGKSTEGCSAIAITPVEVKPLPAVAITPLSHTVCDGDPVELSATGAQTYEWMPGSLSGASQTVFPSAGAADYTVTGTNSDGCVNSANIQVATDACTGISSARITEIQIVPNPSHGVFTVSVPLEGQKTLTVRNAMGQVVNEWSVQGETVEIDLSGFAKGIYVVTVNANGNRFNVRVITE